MKKEIKQENSNKEFKNYSSKSKVYGQGSKGVQSQFPKLAVNMSLRVVKVRINSHWN